MLTSVVVLSSCGGGTVASVLVSGIGGTGISYGTLLGFGSILVNGRHVDDSGAFVTLDGNPGDGSEHGGIKQGMVIKVFGDFSGNTGTATAVEYRDNLEGPVCAAPATVDGIRTLRVLGQTVILDATTIVDNGTIDSISALDIVEVSGLSDNLDRIQASFVEKKTPTEVEVKGFVDAVDSGTKMLTINALDVDFNTALIDDSIPGGEPVVGQFVEVKGAVWVCGGARDSLTATRVELEAEGAGAISADAQAEVEGFITELTSDGFKIGQLGVVTTGSTRILPEDFSVTDLVVGGKVEVEGSFANGVLTAAKISFRRNVKLESDVLSVNGDSFTLKGLPGIVITTNSETSGDPAVGHIRVRGIEGPNNTVLATRIDRKSGDTDAFLQGLVDAKVGATVTVLGVDVDTSGLVFEDIDEFPVSGQQFLDLVQPGTLVKFKGILQGPDIVFEEAELED
jgi:hypothetical protein